MLVSVARVHSFRLSLVALSSLSWAMSVASPPRSAEHASHHRYYSLVVGSTSGACGMWLICGRCQSFLTEAGVIVVDLLHVLLLRLSLLLGGLSSAASRRDVGSPASQSPSTLIVCR